METGQPLYSVQDTLTPEVNQQLDQISEGTQASRGRMRALLDGTKSCAQSTNRILHEHSWKAIGVAGALGVMVGIMAARKRGQSMGDSHA